MLQFNNFNTNLLLKCVKFYLKLSKTLNLTNGNKIITKYKFNSIQYKKNMIKFIKLKEKKWKKNL